MFSRLRNQTTSHFCKVVVPFCIPAGSGGRNLSSRLVMPLHFCPMQVNVGAGSHPNKVKVYGPGVAKTGLKAHEPTYFTVDCTEAGQGKALPWAGGQVGEASTRGPSLCSLPCCR